MTSAVTLYGIANCDSVKKTKKLLDAQEVAYTFYDYKKQAPDATMLKRWIKAFGAEQVINKRGTTWRKLESSQQALAEEDEAKQVQLLLENTSMIKRPIIEKASKEAHLGFNEASIIEFLS